MAVVYFCFWTNPGCLSLQCTWGNYMRGIQRKINRLYDNSFPRVTPRVLRHAFCTNMQQAGIDVKSLQYLMGHSNVSVALDVYIHTDFNTVQKAFSTAHPACKNQFEVLRHKLPFLPVKLRRISQRIIYKISNGPVVSVLIPILFLHYCKNRWGGMY